MFSTLSVVSWKIQSFIQSILGSLLNCSQSIYLEHDVERASVLPELLCSWEWELKPGSVFRGAEQEIENRLHVCHTPLQLCMISLLLNFVFFFHSVAQLCIFFPPVPLWIFFQNVPHCPSVRLLQSPSADSLSVRAAWWEESRESRRSLISPHFTTNSNAPNLPGTRLSGEHLWMCTAQTH